MTDDSREAAVVCLHGLWMAGLEFLPLQRRLSRAGMRPRTFLYSTTLADLETNAERLARYLTTIDEPEVHLVAHSMGGLLVLALLAEHSDVPPGRCVFLGSPVRGSVAGRNVGSAAGLRWALGKAHGAFDEAEPRWEYDRELLLIAGSLGVGLGHVVAKLDGPNDGTVLVEETRMDGATAHVVVPISHTGLPVAPRVGELVTEFLVDGTVPA